MNNGQPTIELSFTITAIIAIAALISPIITSMIDNHHQKKMRLLELQQQDIINNSLYKREIILSYLSATGKCIMHYDNITLQLYGENYAKAYSFIENKETVHQMELLNDSINNLSMKEAKNHLDILLPMIKEEI